MSLLTITLAAACGDSDPPEPPTRMLSLSVQSTPFDGSVEALWGTGPDDVFLAGCSEDGTKGTVDQLVGGTWVRMDSTAQWSVSGTSQRNVWTAGLDVLFYEGASWQKPVRILPDGPGRARGILALGDERHREVWIVGDALRAEIDGKELRGTAWRVRWNGDPSAAPTMAPVDTTLTGSIEGVIGVAPDDVWVYGEAGAAHFDGSGWEQMSSSPVRAAWASRSDDVWFVGAGRQVQRWDGRVLQRVDVGAGDGELSAVWASGPDDVWIGGARGSVVHFDGTRWDKGLLGSQDVHALWGSGTTLWAGGPGWLARVQR